MNEAKLRANLSLIQRVHEESGADILLALKGFSLWKAFPILKEYLQGATASSLNEAKLIADEWGDKAHLCFPVYREEEFDELLPIASHITFNSTSQAERFAPRCGKEHKLALRLNPEVSLVETDLYNPSSPGSRLGVTSALVPERLPEGITGLHVHNLCESSSQDLETTLKAVEVKFGGYLEQASWMNLGGGHLMTREGYDVEHLIGLLRDFKAKWGLEELILEPGAAHVWQTGELMASVVDMLERAGKTILMLDISVSAHMPDCLEMPYQARIRGVKFWKEGDGTKYRVGGMTCLAGDVMGDYSFARKPQVGDRIVFEDMMHYTMVKTTMFNGVAHPAIGLWTAVGNFVSYRTFGYQDYKARIA